MQQHILKRFLPLALLASPFVFADGAAAVHMTANKDTGLSGIIGNTYVFIYHKNEAAKVSDKTKLDLMAKLVQKQLCAKPDTRALVEGDTLNIMFIYPDEDQATVIRIDDCKGTESAQK